MRWKRNKPKIGATKQKVKFLFFPLTLEGETRWLEFAKIKFEYKESYTIDCIGVPHKKYYWGAIEWLPYDPVKDCEIYKKEGCIHVDGMICNIEECNKPPLT